MADAYSLAEKNKISTLQQTLPHLRVFAAFSIAFDVVFSICGLAFFGVDSLFVILMFSALLSSMYIVWYTNDATRFIATPRKARVQWFWENSTTIWRYTAYKFFLVFGFIITAVIESVRIDVVHVLAHLCVGVYVALGTLISLAALLLILALYIVPRHHQIVDNAAALYDDVSTSQTFAHL